MTDADADRQAHAEIAQANAAMPHPMSDREFRERVIKTMAGDHFDGDLVNDIITEWRRRNG